MRIRETVGLAVTLSLALLSTPMLATPIFGNGFESARALGRGGSNLIWYDVDSACVAEPQAILTDYHQPGVRSRVRDTLAAMFAAGQRRASVVIFHAHGGGTDPEGLVNELVLDSTGGTLNKQYVTNLGQLLDDIRDAGFVEVLLRRSGSTIRRTGRTTAAGTRNCLTRTGR